MLKFCLLLGLIISTVHAQDLKESVIQLSGEVARQYARPVVTGFGSNLNAGWFHRTPEARRWGFNFEFGWVVMGTFFGKKDQSFSTRSETNISTSQAEQLTNFVYTYEGFSNLDQSQKQNIQLQLVNQLTGQPVKLRFRGPTVLGGTKDSLRIRYAGDALTYTDPSTQSSTNIDLAALSQDVTLPVPGLLNKIPAIPLAVPQLTIGTVYGTQLTLRFLPKSVSKHLGSLSYSGFGIQHNPALWMKQPLPVNLAFALYSQTLRQGDFFITKATAVGITFDKPLGKRLLNLTPYGGILLESSRMKFKYDLVIDGEHHPVSFVEKGENSARATLGLSLRILVFTVNADYSVARYNVVSAGLRLAI